MSVMAMCRWPAWLQKNLQRCAKGWTRALGGSQIEALGKKGEGSHSATWVEANCKFNLLCMDNSIEVASQQRHFRHRASMRVNHYRAEFSSLVVESDTPR